MAYLVKRVKVEVNCKIHCAQKQQKAGKPVEAFHRQIRQFLQISTQSLFLTILLGKGQQRVEAFVSVMVKGALPKIGVILEENIASLLCRCN